MKSLFVFFLVEILALSSGVFPLSVSFSEPLTEESCPDYYQSAAQPVEALDLYTVRDGALRKLTLEGGDIGKGRISVDGYVCGVLLLCRDKTTAQVDGKTMVRAEEKDSSSEKTYTYFPPVQGNAISPNNQFRITVQSGNRVLDIPVQQKGYQTLPTARYEKDLKYKMVFQYLGSKPNIPESGNFEKRIRAVAEGIDAVQRTFGIPLVQKVDIIDYEAIQNAVIREGQRTIWFYTKALRNEAVDELKVMAEHETLHLLVDKKGLTRNSQIRTLFGDLKGFNRFSLERFLLLTKGITVSDSKHGMDRNSMFFSFIDEKHFISGMHGGHSSENLDEFCASFLHSLMYADRFANNLKTFVFPGSAGRPSHLSPSDKKFIVRTYLRTIEILMNAVTPPSLSSSAVHSDATLSLLEKDRAEIQKTLPSS